MIKSSVQNNQVIKYIPKCEKDSKKPTTICFLPMTKGKYDRYVDSLTEYKHGKVISKAGESGKKIFDVCLASDENGVFIYNAEVDGKEVDKITVKIDAINFLLGLTDMGIAKEIEDAMRGESTLSEDEEKN